MTPEERAQFIAEVAAAASPAPVLLSDEEVRWVRLAIHKQEQSIALRQAIIEKTLGGLAWSGLVGLGYMVLEFVRNHGVK